MTHRILPLMVATMLAGAIARSLGAQTVEEVVAYQGIMRTPVGALSPIMTNTLINRLQNGGSLAIRYGHLSSGALNPTTNGFGVTGVLPAGLGSTVSLTGGAITSDCAGCSAELMLGAGGDIRLYSNAMGTTRTSPLFTVSLDGQLGYSKNGSGNFFSGYVGVPLTLVARGGGMQFVPFLTPGFGFAQTSGSGLSNSGTVTLVGGGVGIYNAMSNVTVNVGFQHAFITDGQMMVGLSLSIGGR